MAARVIQITDGTTTINFDGSGAYTSLNTWRPLVATRRRGVMGNQLPWEDVIEEIPIKVTGADVDTLVANEAALVNLIDQAQRWQDGENVAAVLFKYRTQDSTLTNALSSPILGIAGPVYEYEPELYELVDGNLARTGVLRFVRLGVWLGDAETQTSASVTHTELASDTFTGDADLLSPVEISFDGFSGSDDGSDPLGSDVVFGVTDASTNVDILNSSAASVVSVPGSGTFNVTATIRRELVPNSAGTYTINYSVTLPTDDWPKLFIVFLKVQNNSSTINYSAYLESVGIGIVQTTSRRITIPADANSGNPYIVGFPIMSHRGDIESFNLNVIPDGTGGSSESLIVGDFVAQLLDETNAVSTVTKINRDLTTAHDGNLVVKHDLLGTVNFGNPDIYELYGGELAPRAFDNALFLSKGTSINAWMMGTTGTDWEIINGTDGGTHSDAAGTVEFVRRIAYLIPQ